MIRSSVRCTASLVALALLGAACSSDGSSTSGTSSASGTASNLAAQVASPDLFVGAPQDFELGIFASDDSGVKLVSFGSVTLTFSYLGVDGSAAARGGVPDGTFSATYVPAPGTGEGQDPGVPSLTAPADARGVYVNQDVRFAEPGVYEARVAADIDGIGAQTLTATFQVRPEPSLPAPGDRALKTKNHVIGDKGIEPVAIDSQAQDGSSIPDPELHRTTIAQAIAAGTPALVLFATPVYCQSLFCGPTLEAMQALAADHAGQAAFIHVEIWRDYDKSIVNEAAADWLLRDGDLTEPWLYLIGGDGTIFHRWGPLFDPSEVAAALDALPTD
ncbi:MAG: hypothetical protein ABI572_11430 [Actinomycetota bacterium]